MKRFFKWVLIGFSSLFAIVVLAAIILPAVYKDKIRVDLEKEIDRQIDAEVTFSEVSLRLFSHFPNLTLSLKDLLVRGKEEFKTDTLTSVREARLELKLWRLLSKREVEIKSIQLYDPEIHIYILKNGRANYNITKPTIDSVHQTQSSSVNIAIDKLSIHSGDIFYTDWQKNTFVSAIDIEHEGSGDFLKDLFDYKTNTVIRQFSLRYDNVQYFLKKTIGIDLIMEMNIPENRFAFKENRIQINHFIFSIEGFFQQVVNEYAMKLKFQAQETSFKNILSLVPGLYMKNFDYMETHGDLGFSGFLDGIYSDSTKEMPAFRFDMNVKNAMVKIDSLPEAFNNIGFELVIENHGRILDSTLIELKNFNVDLGRHPVHGNVKIQGIHTPRITSDVFADVEIATLERLFPIKKLALKGKLNFELKTNGTYDEKKSIVPAFSLNLQLSDGYIKYDTMPRPISNIHFHLNAESNDGKLKNAIVDFRKIHAELDDNTLHGFLKLTGYPDTEIDADLDADLDLEDLEKIYPMKDYTIKGKFTMDVWAKGLYSKSEKKFPLVDTKLKLTDGSVQYKKYPYPIKDIQFFAEATSKTSNLADAKFNVSKLTYTLEDQPFEITGSLANLNNYEYSLTINGKADLSKLAQVYPLEGIQLAGIIDAQLKTSGLLSDLENGNYSKVSSTGTMSFNNINISGTRIKNPVSISNALLTFTPAKIILENLEGKLGKSNVKIKGEISNYMAFATQSKDLVKGDLDLSCDTLDINEWMPPAQTATGKPVAAADTTHSKLTVIEVPKNVDFVFDSEIQGLKYEDLKITDMKGEITVKDGVLSLHETGFNSISARFSLSGSYNTRDIAHPVFDFDMDVKDLDIHRAYQEIGLMRQLAPSAANTYGKFSVTYKLQGELTKDMQPKLETLTGGGIMRIAEAKINGMKMFDEISKSAKKKEINDPHLKDFEMVTEIKDGKIIVKPFSIKVSGFDADIEGVNTMSGMINYLVKIELVPLTKIKIPFHVTGRYDNPKVALGKGHTLPY
jgi:AsmA protein